MFHLLLAVIYLAFISLGLPDALLGAAWPVMYPQFEVSVSFAGVISMIISAGTIISSLQSDRITRTLGTGKVTAISVAITAVALWGFSTCDTFWQLCLWAIPYGLGAGSVDASINNYVALHYASHHMSWLHCMWGIGASAGPYIMSYALAGEKGWPMGYRYIAWLQFGLTFILFLSLPMWKERNASAIGKNEEEGEQKEKKEREAKKDTPLTLRQVVRIPGVREVMVTFFCYCALESTAGLWASSYLVLSKGVNAETAAGWGSLFYLGITAGRALSGFLTFRWNDTQMIRIGQSVILMGILVLFLPLGHTVSLIGLILAGLGCAPIYPSVIHSTPDHFGADRSQAIIGIQMASAYVGSCLMPPIFGFLAEHITTSLYPIFLLLILILMFIMHEKLCRKSKTISA